MRLLIGLVAVGLWGGEFEVKKLTDEEVKVLKEKREELEKAQIEFNRVQQELKRKYGDNIGGTIDGNTMLAVAICVYTSVELKGEYALISTSRNPFCGGFIEKSNTRITDLPCLGVSCNATGTFTLKEK